MEFTTILQSFTSLFPSSKLIKKNPLPFTVMILSPHPDDESIIGSLALRLAQENKAHVINVAATLGSKTERQEARRKELKAACDFLEMELFTLNDDWKKKSKELKTLIQQHNPHLILAPHSKDHHPTHIKTSLLLKDVLAGLKKNNLLVAWTEFWFPLIKPNLLVEVPCEILAMQMQGLSKHVGEIARNPYHLRLPAWMMDNVRRGAEFIPRPGGKAPPMAFGVLYQLQLAQNGKLTTVKLPEAFLGSSQNIGQIFKEILEAASGSKTRVK